MKIRCANLKENYLIEITPENKVELKIVEKIKVKNGFADRTGKIKKKDFMKYWGDTDEENNDFGKNNSGIKIFLKKN